MSADESSKISAQQAQARLLAGHASEDPFAAAFKATRMPMIITDPRQADNPIIFANHAFCDLTGYHHDELLGQNCRLLQGPQTDRGTVNRIRTGVEARVNVSENILNYRRDGSTFWNALFISPVKDEADDTIYFFASQLDFTSVKNNEFALAQARLAAEKEVADRTQDLRQALQAKTVLVHEVDHRVKNNLLTIASLLKLQARNSSDPVARDTLRSVLDRVEALSTVQRMLFTTDDVTRFDIAEFTRERVVDMVNALKRDDVRLELDLSPVLVPAIKASPLALIVNELVGDASRRGLRDFGGKMRVTVRRQNGHFLIEIADQIDGSGKISEEASFSQLIIDTCARQLRAQISREQESGAQLSRVILPVEAIIEGPIR
ncbi:PAS domain-containing protein [Allorhizobium undicola]|uniref:PAS domain-containing protein n=1 Tax=Allorhizobium undicola TaxID=78527 RepID=UPI00048A2716|nr:PAS domain-containing protein [Allorhizobium undicola]